MKDKCTIGGIIRHKLLDGYGFKITFSSIELAQKYKEMLRIIIDSDGIKVKEEIGYNDSKQS